MIALPVQGAVRRGRGSLSGCSVHLTYRLWMLVCFQHSFRAEYIDGKHAHKRCRAQDIQRYPPSGTEHRSQKQVVYREKHQERKRLKQESVQEMSPEAESRAAHRIPPGEHCLEKEYPRPDCRLDRQRFIFYLHCLYECPMQNYNNVPNPVRLFVEEIRPFSEKDGQSGGRLLNFRPETRKCLEL